MKLYKWIAMALILCLWMISVTAVMEGAADDAIDGADDVVSEAVETFVEETTVELGGGDEAPMVVEQPDPEAALMAASAVKSGQCGDYMNYTIDSSGLLTITGSGAMWNFSEYTSRFGGSVHSDVKTIKIGSGVTSIGKYAFASFTNLTSVSIPNTVKVIEEHAFSNCPKLTSVKIPSGVTTSGVWAFAYCSALTEVSLPNSVKKLGMYAFYECRGLKSATLSRGIQEIETETFGACSGLTSLTVPNGTTYIDSYAFSSCLNLKSLNLPRSVLYIGENILERCGRFTDVYYAGTVSDRARIDIKSPNSVLLNTAWHYGASSSTTPAPTSKPTSAPTPKPTTMWDDDNYNLYNFSMNRSMSRIAYVGDRFWVIFPAGDYAVTCTSSDSGIASVVSTWTDVITIHRAVKLKIDDLHAPTSVRIDQGMSLMVQLADRTVSLSATMTSKASPAKSALTWTSSKPDVATVSSKGVVTLKKTGKTKITVKAGARIAGEV